MKDTNTKLVQRAIMFAINTVSEDIQKIMTHTIIANEPKQ